MRLTNLAYAAALAVMLMGCSTVRYEYVKGLPPPSLLLDCASPTYPVGKNAELAEGLLLERNALALCNNDKAALREWALPTKE